MGGRVECIQKYGRLGNIFERVLNGGAKIVQVAPQMSERARKREKPVQIVSQFCSSETFEVPAEGRGVYTR